MPPRRREERRSDVTLRAKIAGCFWAEPLLHQLEALNGSALRRAVEILECLAEVLRRKLASETRRAAVEIEEEDL